MTRNDTTLLTTRPSLATELLQNGCKAKATVNPYDSDKTAWTFLVTARTMELVEKYYRERHIKLPTSYKTAFENFRKGGDK